MPGQVRNLDRRSQTLRLSVDALSTDSQDPRSQLVFTKITVVVGCYEFVNNELRSKFETMIEVPESLLTIYDNSPVAPPENGVWARFTVEHENARTLNLTCSPQTHRKEGSALIRLMASLEGGDRSLLQLADAIDTAFLGVTDQVVYGTTSMDVVGREGRWWVIEVRAPWHHDDVSIPTNTGGGFALPDFEALHNAVRTRFEAQVETPEGVIAIYDNSPVDPPENALSVRVAVRPGLSFRAENGGRDGCNRFRTPGVLMATILAPLETGDRDALRLVDVINTAFRAVTASGVTYQTPRVTNEGRDEDGRWWQIVVTCPFYSDDIA
tara:strand:- start:42970 stop:43944 length:975 start_codon:yes stop_codon:yes gene_type:complete